MKREHLVAAAGIFLAALPLVAQQGSGNIAVLEFQKPKNGILRQYELDGNKRPHGISSRTILSRCWYGKYSAVRIRERTLSARWANIGRISINRPFRRRAISR